MEFNRFGCAIFDLVIKVKGKVIRKKWVNGIFCVAIRFMTDVITSWLLSTNFCILLFKVSILSLFPFLFKQKKKFNFNFGWVKFSYFSIKSLFSFSLWIGFKIEKLIISKKNFQDQLSFFFLCWWRINAYFFLIYSRFFWQLIFCLMISAWTPSFVPLDLHDVVFASK